MKRIFTLILGIMALTLGACSSNDPVYNDMPADIMKFVAQYYPNSKVETFTETDASYRLVLDDGPTMVFNKTCQWQKLDGNGSVLVQNFLFNELPPELYEYLQNTDELNQVFSVSRDSKEYTVELLNSSLTYNIATGKLTGKDYSR